MKCFFLLAVSVVALVKAQYDQPPEEAGQGNPYYDHEAAPPAYEGQEGDLDRQAPPHHAPPPQEAHAGQNEHGPDPQGERRSSPFPGGLSRRNTIPVENDTFTLPAYYHSVSTTQRVVRINRRNYPQMIDALVRDGVLKSQRVIEAFKTVDRGHFVHTMEDEPYGFMARKLGRGVFMEKPHMQARMIELLASHIHEGASVLDVGSGTGFMSCVFAELAGKTGKVLGVEHIREQCEDSFDTVNRVRPDLLREGRLHLRCRDGRVGVANMAPYDAIYYSPYVQEVPYAILLQLKPGGRLICGVGKNRAFHRVVVVDRSADGESFQKFDLGTENFINPLVNANDQNDNWLYQQSRRRIIEAKNQGLSGLQLARRVRLYTKKPVDLKKLEDDSYKFLEV